jgi:hypothetical protein
MKRENLLFLCYSSPFGKMVALAGDIDFGPKKTLKGEENI